ncbi:MAG: hypothetical protein Q9222_003851 [Ikaeria aurantiellina]
MRLCPNSLWKLPRSVGKRAQGQTPLDRWLPSARNQLRIRRHGCSASTVANISYRESSRQRKGLNHDGDHAESQAGCAQNIFIGDLEATLEAHRAYNRAKVIRRIDAPPDPRYKHILPESYRDDANRSSKFDTASHSLEQVAVEKQDEDKEPGFGWEHDPSPKAKEALKPWDYWPAGSIQHQRFRQSKQAVRSGLILEYHARMMGPTDSWKLKSSNLAQKLRRPWLDHLKERGGDALERLGSEIKAFELYMSLSYLEKSSVQKISTKAQGLITDSLRDCVCEVIGSHNTGTALAYSDIDIAVSLPEVRIDAAHHRKSLHGRKYKKIYHKALSKVQAAFRKNRDFEDCPTLVPGRIPIVQATHRATGCKVQVQITSGVLRQKQYTLAYLAEYPTLRPLYVVLRSTLEFRRLNIPFEGGLGSYALLMMIVNALKHASGRYDPFDLGAQLLLVLDFYSTSNLYRQGYSIEPPCIFQKGRKPLAPGEQTARLTEEILTGIDAISKGDARKPYLLCLQDPADPRNDLGSKAYAIKHIQKTFAVARRILKENMEAWNHRPDHSASDPPTDALLDILLQANYRRFEFNRNKTQTFGSAKIDHVLDSDGNRIKTSISSPRQEKLSAQEMLRKVIEIDERKTKEVDS